MDMENFAKREISSLMTEPLTLSKMSSISKVVGLLRDRGAYEVFIDGVKPGMVTARDLLNVSNPTSTKLETLMIQAPRLLRNAPIRETARIMLEHRIRSLPVVEGKKVVGQIGILGIISLMREYMPSLSADKVMTPKPITLDERDKISKARNLMRRRRIDHLPILSSGRLAGILTSSHLIAYLLPAEGVGKEGMVADIRRRTDVEVGSIMDRQPLTCEPDEDVRTVASRIIERHSTYSLVTLEEEVQGIITLRDFMKLIVPQAPKSEVPVYMVGLPDDPFEAETAKSKFIRSIDVLRRSFPDILEARSTIKTKDVGGERRRYEVRILIRTPRRTFNYTENGYDLANVYDILSDRVKRLMAQKPSRRGRTKTVR